jgi:hypothetical protein
MSYETFRRPPQLDHEEFVQALADLETLGMLRVVVWPTPLMAGAMVTDVRRVQRPRLVPKEPRYDDVFFEGLAWLDHQ